MDISNSHNAFTHLLLNFIKIFVIVVIFIFDLIQGTSQTVTNILDTTLRPSLETGMIFVLHKINIFLQFELLDSTSIKHSIDKMTWSCVKIITSIDLKQVKVNDFVCWLSNFIHNCLPFRIESLRISGSHTIHFVRAVNSYFFNSATILIKEIEEMLHSVKIIVFHVDSKLLNVRKLHKSSIDLVDPKSSEVHFIDALYVKDLIVKN
mmetsp:Transcript_114176/g.158438  ORF Transcript_114176/g.158438 Transcript_114176/m.158438 type:complete len:207 (-) Transcript_114176:228-848(-)